MLPIDPPCPNRPYYHLERGGLLGNRGLARGKLALGQRAPRGTGLGGQSAAAAAAALAEPQGARWGAFDPHSYSVSFLASVHLAQRQQEQAAGGAAGPQQDILNFCILNMALNGLGARLDMTEVEVQEDQYLMQQERFQPDDALAPGGSSALLDRDGGPLAPVLVEDEPAAADGASSGSGSDSDGEADLIDAGRDLKRPALRLFAAVAPRSGPGPADSPFLAGPVGPPAAPAGPAANATAPRPLPYPLLAASSTEASSALFSSSLNLASAASAPRPLDESWEMELGGADPSAVSDERDSSDQSAMDISASFSHG